MARHIAMLAPFPNAISAAVLTGADLVNWLERAAAFFSPTWDERRHLINPHAPSYNFDKLYGLEAVIDPFPASVFDPNGHVINPNSRRVHRLSYNSAPVDPKASFLVAMTSYRGSGGGNYPGIANNPDVLHTDFDLGETLYTTVPEVIDAPLDCAPTFRFAPFHTKRVIIETSPKAERYLDEIAAFDPQVIGLNAAGFLELDVLI